MRRGVVRSITVVAGVDEYAVREGRRFGGRGAGGMNVSAIVSYVRLSSASDLDFATELG